MRHLFATALTFAIVAGAFVARAQQPPPAEGENLPRFRGGVAFVTVDVYPRRDGQVVEGLGPDDFRVFEDGKLQKIETFQAVTFDPLTPGTERRDPNSVAESEDAARDPHNRVYVVYLDPYHTDVTSSHEAPATVAAFLERVIGPRDVFGFMTPETPLRTLTFARRTDTIEAELRRHWAWGLKSQTDQPQRVIPQDAAERAIANACGRDADLAIRVHREDRLMSSLEQLMLRLQALRDERKNVLFLSEGWTPQSMSAPAAPDAGGPPPITVGPGGRIGTNRRADGAPQNLESECRRLVGHLSGIDFEQRFRELIERAQRANVAFYPIDLGGLKAVSAMTASSADGSIAAIMRGRAASGGARNTLLTLAENTDGLAVVDTNDLTAGARRIAGTQSSYYLLGYYSTNPARDGRYRRIEVKATRPGLRVAARPGYQAPTEEEYRAATAPPVSPTAVNVSEALARLSVTRRDEELFVRGIYADRTLDIVVELPPDALGDSRWASGAEVTIATTSPGGPGSTETARIAPGEGTARVIVPVSGPAAGPWEIRAVAAAGNTEAEARTHVVAGAHGPWIGEPRVLRAGPAARALPRPTATSDFHRRERLVVEVRVADGAPPPEVRMLDRRGQPLDVAAAITQARGTEDGVWQITVTMAPFAAGEYVLDVSVSDGTTRDQRLVPFRVVP